MPTLRPPAVTLTCTLALALALSLSACASRDRSPGIGAFERGDLVAARQIFEADVAQGGADTTLELNAAGTAALAAGDVEGARRHFTEAYVDLEDLTATTGETLGAMVGPERSKRWKGDPHERCMNAYYLGVTHWLSGDVDNAAASFKAGLLRDADSDEGDAQSDFALLWYLMGQAQREARHSDRGAQALRRAKELLPANPYASQGAASEPNLLVVVELGRGPRKVPDGPHGAWVRFVNLHAPEAYATISIDGRDLGATARAEEIYKQAITRGDKVLDHFNQGKAVFKSAATVSGAYVLSQADNSHEAALGAGLILLGALTPSEADLRQWATLPGEVHVLAAKLPVGEYDLRVDMRDAGGRDLAGLSSSLPVQIRDNRTTFVWARALPGGTAIAWSPPGAAGSSAP